jgi:uncharacterized protein YjdB
MFAITMATFAVNNSSWGQNYAGEKTATAAGNLDLTSWIAPLGVAEAPRYLLKIVAETVDPQLVKSGVNVWNTPNRQFPTGYPTGYGNAQWAPSFLPGTYYISNEEKGRVLYDINYISWPEVWKNGTKMGNITHGGTQFSYASGITPAMFPVEQSGGYVKLKPNTGEQLELKTSVYFTNNGSNQGYNRLWSGILSSGWTPGPFGSNTTNYTLPMQNGEYTYASRAYSTDIEYNPFYVEYASSTIPVSGVSLSPTNLTAILGDASTSLTATVQPSNATNQTVFWTSRNTNVATVSNGMVSFVGVGNAVIEVKTQDGNFTATCEVTVQAPQPNQYSIDVVARPPNGGSVTGGGKFNAGTTQAVVATPANGWEFVNWTENGSPISTSASYSFTLNGDRSLVAHFVEDSGSGIEPVETSGLALHAAGETLTVKNVAGETTITIYGITGTLVYRRVVRNDTDFFLPRGMYIVKATASGGTVVRKIITR